MLNLYLSNDYIDDHYKSGYWISYPENKLSYHELYPYFLELSKLSSSSFSDLSKTDINIITRSGCFYFNIHNIVNSLDNILNIGISIIPNKKNKHIKHFSLDKFSTCKVYHKLMQYTDLIHKELSNSMVREAKLGYLLNGEIDNRYLMFKLLEGKKTYV